LLEVLICLVGVVRSLPTYELPPAEPEDGVEMLDEGAISEVSAAALLRRSAGLVTPGKMRRGRYLSSLASPLSGLRFDAAVSCLEPKIGRALWQENVPLSALPLASGHALIFTRCVGMVPLLYF
jgi:hypothetical protein